jgi:RNA polymerase sigma factor (sigma-70 family)
MNSEAAKCDVQFLNLHQDLINGCKRNDQKAQFQIYKLYYKAMFNTSLRIVNDTMEAEDIMQESFLSAFEKIGSYSGTVSFGAWLKKIVQNRSLDYLRKKRKLIYEDIESLQEADNNFSETVSLDEESDPLMNKIIEAIKLLPEIYHKVVSLYLFEGYDHEEISHILSIPSSTSRSHFSRARYKIISEINGTSI